MSGSRVTCCH